MARHARSVDDRARAWRLVTLLVVWAAGLTAGYFAFLAAAAKYGCGQNEKGLACRTSGSVVGILVVIAVVMLVAAVTVLTFDRPPRRVATVGVIGVIGLGLCLIAAHSLLGTA